MPLVKPLVKLLAIFVETTVETTSTAPLRTEIVNPLPPREMRIQTVAENVTTQNQTAFGGILKNARFVKKASLTNENIKEFASMAKAKTCCVASAIRRCPRKTKSTC
jgi:hypothetical protein